MQFDSCAMSNFPQQSVSRHKNLLYRLNFTSLVLQIFLFGAPHLVTHFSIFLRIDRRSRSYKTFFLCFPIFNVQFECFATRRKITNSKMTQLSIKKWKNYLLAKKKSFIGLATVRNSCTAIDPEIKQTSFLSNIGLYGI